MSDNQTRVEIGTMAPIDVVQAQSQAATQRQNLATAEGTRRTDRADAQAADRQRHAGSQLERQHRPDRSARFRADAGRRRRRRSAARSTTAPTWQQVKKNLQVNDVTLKFLQQPDAAPGRCRRRATGSSARAARSSSTSGTGVNRVVTGDDSRRLRRRAEHAVRPQLPDLERRAQRQLPARHERAGSDRTRARRSSRTRSKRSCGRSSCRLRPT